MLMGISETKPLSLSTEKSIGERGQVALFVALIFQVLFVFFAMVINVGLLVHHKINLQNSVDIAAYYGAAKQAEMLNAMAHINYQIRQSYKLLMFRYHQLGSAGENTTHPFDNRLDQQVIRRDQDVKSTVPTAFCMAYRPFSLVDENESYCKKLDNLVIDKPQTPNLIGDTLSFISFQVSVRTATEALRGQITDQCRKVGQQNYFSLARFIAGYKFDVANRKKLFLNLANELSREKPFDVDGKEIREGVYKTLLRNLTIQNSDSLKASYGEEGNGNGNNERNFEFLNGLALGDCGGKGNDLEPPGWVSEMLIFPYLRYLDAACEGDTSTRFFAKPISLGNESSDPLYKTVITEDMLRQLKPLVDEPTGEDPRQRLFKSSLGFEKNPWCMAYVGVKAKTTPRIPFTPIGSVTIEARAFAKPFGGKIGPWYGTTWQSGQPKSSGQSLTTKTDILVPLRVDTGRITVNPNDPDVEINFAPSVSRYWGDEIGQRSELTMAHAAQAIHRIEKIDFMWWTHLLDDDLDTIGSAGDSLAWDNEAGRSPPMRNLEIASIAPDQFDITHYSIEADFADNYLLRLRQGYGNKYNYLMRPDLGTRLKGAEDKLARFNIRHQIETVMDPQKNTMDVTNKLTYFLTDFGGLLTSWQAPNSYDYSLDPNRFGKCLRTIDDDIDINKKTTGSCIAGGRTGYSVKLVDGKYLKETGDLELGGPGIRGPLSNIPPGNF
jgi:hypothetical protein